MSGFSRNVSKSRSRGKQIVSNYKKMEQIAQMDPENYFKCFVSAAKQYSNKKNETTLRTLQKQLDNLLYVKISYDSFDPRTLLISDCIINLIELLNDQTPHDIELKEKIIIFFESLAREQPIILNVMQVTFNLSLALESFLSGIIDEYENPIFLKSLNLLEFVTRNGPVELSHGVSDNLLLFLIKNIFLPDSILLIPCLKLLANLCRHSQRIFRRVKSLENYTSFCKNVMSMVKKDSVLSISALSLFNSLMSQDTLGVKLMNPTIIQEIIEILFNIFAKESGNDETFIAAVDLFLNLLENSKVISRLEKYKHLHTCLTHILEKLLPDLSYSSITKIIQFFNSLNKLESAESIAQLVLTHEVENSCLISFAIDRLSIDNEKIESSIIALDYLINIFKFIVPPATPIDLGDLITSFITKCVQIISEPFETDKLIAKWKCQQISQVFAALTIYKENISKQIELTSCQALIDTQFVNNIIQYDRIYSAADWSETGVDVVVQIINFSRCFGEDNLEFKEFITLTLQDWRLIPFLASYLSSTSKEKVQLAFKIIQTGIVSNCISFERLSEVMASNYCKLKRNVLTSDSNEPTENGDKIIYLLSPQKLNDNGQSVDDLIEKMENGLKLNDIKASEIMQMYEYKIESFSMKEKHLHDLLEAKSTALQQLERILSLYRCRWAQSDAEALNLRRLLQEAEKRSEAAKQQTLVAMMENQDVQKAHEETLNELRKNMEDVIEERNELIDKSEKGEETINELNKEMERKDQINKLLQQHIDDHKQNETVLSNKLSDLEKIKKQLTNQLKEKETELSENIKCLDKLKEKLDEQKDEIKNQNKQIAKFKSNIESLELEKSSLQEEIASLENTNADLDKQLKENEVQLKEKCEELNKQKYITSLIQNITSGRVDLSLLDEKK